MADPVQRGRFVWYELLTSDPDAATDFYPSVTGWNTAPFEGGAQPYTMWTNADVPVGGVMELPDDAKAAGTPPNWLCYVASPDVDATARRAESLGGRVVVPPADIPNVGRFSVLADPQGAVFAVYKSATDQSSTSSEATPKQGEVSWHELTTTDHEAAFNFYHDLFGWEKTDAFDMGPEMGTYQMFGRHGAPFGGMFNKTPDMPVPPNWLPYVTVDDVHEAAERVKQHGGQVINGPMEVPGGDWIVQCTDPQGAVFALNSPQQS